MSNNTKPHRGKRFLFAGVWTLGFGVNAYFATAQSTPAPGPRFEVASIRPGCGAAAIGRSPDGRANVAVPATAPGRLSTCRPLVTPLIGPQNGLIQEAYGRYAGGRINPPWTILPVEGGPTWLQTDFFLISATAGTNVSEEIMRGPMMQALLEERFKLKLHRETREGPIYELVVAKGGPKLKPFQEGSCVPIDLTKQTPGRPPTPPPGKRLCDSSRTRGGPLGLSQITNAEGVSLQWLAYTLQADRPVIDKTGLGGLFDIHLEYEPDRAAFPPPPPPGGPAVDTSDQPPGSIGPSIFTAVQEQLGLRLEPAKGPREVLVIDSIEKPSEN